MILVEKDSGQTVNVKVGDTITIRLDENPTTGYRWTLVTSSGLEQVSDQYNAGVGIGAAGTHEIQFRTSRAGSYELRFDLLREWETKVIQSWEARVVVEGS